MTDAFGPDARPDGVQSRLGCRDRDLGPQSRLARDGTHLEGAGFDLRYRSLEQAMDDRARRARPTDLRLSRVPLSIENHDEHGAAGMQKLARDLLLRRHDTFGAAEVDVDGARLGAIDDAGRQLAAVLSDVAQHLFALEIVNVTEHGVLRCLRGHAFEILRRQGAELVPDAACHLERPGAGVEGYAHVTRRIERAHIRDRERILHRVEHLLETNADLRAEPRQGVCEAFGRRLRLRPRACPRQRHPMQCERLPQLSPARPRRIPQYRQPRPRRATLRSPYPTA